MSESLPRAEVLNNVGPSCSYPSPFSFRSFESLSGTGDSWAALAEDAWSLWPRKSIFYLFGLVLRWGQGDSFLGLALTEQTELPRTVKSEQVSTRTEMPAEVTEGCGGLWDASSQSGPALSSLQVSCKPLASGFPWTLY